MFSYNTGNKKKKKREQDLKFWICTDVQKDKFDSTYFFNKLTRKENHTTTATAKVNRARSENRKGPATPSFIIQRQWKAINKSVL